jgi:hypothetical protein
MDLVKRVVVYDTTDKYLSPLWAFWAWVGRVLGIYSFTHGFSSWEQFVAILSKYPEGSVFELQLWGHGGPGKAYINNVGKNFNPNTPEFKVLKKIIYPRGGLVWFRSCSMFAGEEGHKFAKALSSNLEVNIAAHTYVIGTWGVASGLHLVGPGNNYTPHWDLTEGYNKEGGLKRSKLTDKPFIPAIIFTVPLLIVVGCLLTHNKCRDTENLFKKGF